MREWGPNIIQEKMNVDVAVTNSGGIRADAFPIKEGADVTISKIYQIMPFDNVIKTCKLKGSDIKKIASMSGINISKSLETIDGIVYINGKQLIDDEYYTVATIDYLFDKPEYPFLKGTDIVNNGLLYRDLMIEVIENLTENNQKWNPKN